jgi:hypothetical protein
MAIQTGSGVSLAIGTTAAATTLGQYQADSYTTVGEVSEIGAFGDERNVVSFLSLADGRVRKARGSANAGDAQVTYAYDSTNSGQDNLRTAFNTVSQSADEFNFRVQFNDSLGSNPTTWYFRARITQRRVQNITTDAIVMVNATLAINSALVEQEAA